MSAGDLDGKVALVTGAGRGIGAAAARLLARDGARVVLAARSGPELAAVAEEIRADGGTADHVVADLAAAAGVARAVGFAESRHGRLDLAFNNAGVSARHVPMVELSEDELDLVTSVNFTGVFRAVAAEVRAIRRTAGSGAIVNNSSVGAYRGAAHGAAYGATKRAVISLTESAAVEYGPEGIRVNAVAPGPTTTSMIDKWADEDPAIVDRLTAATPLGRLVTPEEVAEAVRWLLGDRAGAVTGATLPVDGGFRA